MLAKAYNPSCQEAEASQGYIVHTNYLKKKKGGGSLQEIPSAASLLPGFCNPPLRITTTISETGNSQGSTTCHDTYYLNSLIRFL